MARRTLPRLAGLPVCAVVLALIAMASLAIGAKSIPLGDVVAGLFGDDGSESAAIVRELRVPRTLVGLAVGVALGLAGALMQALTRNPLADPGILGVEAGAAAAIVSAIALFGVTEPRAYIWFSFLGAAVASVVVYLLGSHGRAGATPVRLALAGTAVTAVADDGERQEVETAADLVLVWLTRGDRPPGTSPVLADALAALELPEGPGRVWGGGEAMAMRAVRDELRGRGVPRRSIQAMGYWKHDTTTEEMW
jgi:iron complex transport system permease protein